MWLQLLLLLLIVILIWWLASCGSCRPRGPATHRLWTPGHFRGSPGRYYMVATGVSPEGARRLLERELEESRVQLSATDFDQASQALELGTILFYFRSEGDVTSLQDHPTTYLAPMGTIEDLRFSEEFYLDGSTVARDLIEPVVRVPFMANREVRVCQNAQQCTPGTLKLTELDKGGELRIETCPEGVRLYQVNDQGIREYLGLGPNLEQAIKEEGGGRLRIGRTETGQGIVFHLEKV